jgi:HK97 family phage major capsid protein
MTKQMRELAAKMAAKQAEVDKFLTDGENKDLEKAQAALDELDAMQKEYDLLERAEKAAKAGVPANQGAGIPGAVDGFKALTKFLNKQGMTEEEKSALISGGENSENYLIPEDVKLEINELRKSYVSARELVTVEPTESLTGSVNYEAGTPAGLADFEDGETITEEDKPTFVRKTFTIGWKGKLIPISRILLGAEKAGLMGYLNRWFVKNAVISENAAIFGKLKAGYNGGTPKAVAGWEALKKSITVDLDPSCLIGAVIATNQSGFAALDAEKFEDGRPVLQANPANPTQKLFQGLPVKVYPDAQLPNIDATHFPVIYGNTKAGCTFVEHQALQFTVSEHFLFNKNQNCLRVLEGFDTMSTDTEAYIYGSFSATVKA